MAKKGDKVWVVTGDSESGDHYSTVFAEAPTEIQLANWCHECDGDEDKCGPANYGSYVYSYVEQIELQ